MKISQFAGVALITLGLASGQVAAEVHEHHDHGHSHGHESGGASLKLNNGSKWATDAHLRQGMSRINSAFAAESGDRMTPAGYVSLGQKIQAEIAFIMQSCKLDKQADAMLHIVLADLIEGSDAMQGKNPALKPRAGALKVRQALENYVTYFDHPGWQ